MCRRVKARPSERLVRTITLDIWYRAARVLDGQKCAKLSIEMCGSLNPGISGVLVYCHLNEDFPCTFQIISSHSKNRIKNYDAVFEPIMSLTKTFFLWLTDLAFGQRLSRLAYWVFHFLGYRSAKVQLLHLSDEVRTIRMLIWCRRVFAQQIKIEAQTGCHGSVKTGLKTILGTSG